MKTHLPILTTVNYNFANEAYSPVKFDINTRITFRGSHCGKQGFHINTFSDPLWHLGSFTREQRLENYTNGTLEQLERPFHYTDEQWAEFEHEMRLEMHSERCLAREMSMY